MPKSRTNPFRKQKLQNFKNKNKQMNEQTPQPQGFPPVRNIPTWDQNAKLEVTGFEWEAIQNGLVQIQLAQQASQSVMSRNIVNGTIKMDFQKLKNPETGEYEDMPEEEKKSYRDDFEQMLNTFRTAAAKQSTPEEVPVTELLNADGTKVEYPPTIPPATEGFSPSSEIVSDEPKVAAKVVKMEVNKK